MSLDLKQSSPQISDSALRLQGEPPPFPEDVLTRFPSLGTWSDSNNRFWRANAGAIQDFARAVLDVTEIAGVLVVDPDEAALYIRRSRGNGAWANPDTSFFVNRDGYFSLLNLLTFNPVERELVVTGTIIADAGVIGGWIISPTTLSKNNAVLDSAGQLALGTGNDVVILSATDATYRIWVGNATAATATFSVTKLGAIFATAGTIGGFNLGTDYIRDVANSSGLASTVSGGDDVRFWAGDTFANRATAPFRVTESGALVATSATITGSITATSGSIGGFSIGADYLRDVANTFGLASTVTGGDDTRLWAGATFANRATAPFRVTESGALVATSATISGTITASIVIVGYTAQYLDSTTSNFQVINTSGQSNLVQNFCFGSGTPNFEGWVAGGTIGAETQALSGRLMKLKLVTYGSGGGGWINGGNASVWLVTTEDHTLTARGTEIRFRTTANGTIAEGYGLVIGNDGRLYIGPDNALARDTNLYRSAANTLKTDDAFECDSLVATNNITGNLFTGSGANLSALNADNISTGTLTNARLPSAISVSTVSATLSGNGAGITGLSSGQISGLGNLATANLTGPTASGDVPINGFCTILGNKLATVA